MSEELLDASVVAPAHSASSTEVSTGNDERANVAELLAPQADDPTAIIRERKITIPVPRARSLQERSRDHCFQLAQRDAVNEHHAAATSPPLLGAKGTPDLRGPVLHPVHVASNAADCPTPDVLQRIDD
jgi:hypothetical protein